MHFIVDKYCNRIWLTVCLESFVGMLAVGHVRPAILTFSHIFPHRIADFLSSSSLQTPALLCQPSQAEALESYNSDEVSPGSPKLSGVP